MFSRRPVGHAEAAQRRRAVSQRPAQLVRRMDRRRPVLVVTVVVVLAVGGRHTAQRHVGRSRVVVVHRAAAGRRPPRWLGRRGRAEAVQLHADAAAAVATPAAATGPVRAERGGHQGDPHDVQQSHTRELRVSGSSA